MAEQRTESERIIAIEATYEHLATKADIANLRTDIANQRTEFKGDNAALRDELKDDIANLRSELKNDIANLRSELKDDIANLRSELKDDIANLGSELRADSAQMRENSTAFQSSVNTSFRNIKWFITVAVAAGAVGVTIINTIVTVALALALRGV